MRLNKVSASAKRNAPPPPKGKLTYVRIEVADNGCVVSAEYAPHKGTSAKEMNSMPYQEPERKVFTSLREAGDYIAGLEGPAAPPPTEGPDFTDYGEAA